MTMLIRPFVWTDNPASWPDAPQLFSLGILGGLEPLLRRPRHDLRTGQRDPRSALDDGGLVIVGFLIWVLPDLDLGAEPPPASTSPGARRGRGLRLIGWRASLRSGERVRLSLTMPRRAAREGHRRLLVALVALLHLGFLVLEMFLWTTRSGLNLDVDTGGGRVLRGTGHQPGSLRQLLAAGLVWGLLARENG